MGKIDLTDYTEAWRANEASGNLLGINGDDIPVVGSVGSVVGHIEDPPGSLLGRGLLRPIGDAGVDAYFARAFAASDIFDIRGQVSCTMAMWFFLPATNTDGPTGFTIHNPANANGQALQLVNNHFTVGVNPAPLFLMLDGLSAFNALIVQATDAVSPPADTWQFNAGGYDAARNKIFHFWGRAAGESYYAEADGFAAGFGYTGAAGCQNSFGQYEGPGGGTNIAQRIDQSIWWKGRALNQAELNFLWNNHAGRALDDLVELVAAARHYTYYYA